MFETKIKPDYSEAIAKFVKSGGQIKQAVNTNKAEFNYCNADTAIKSAERPNSHQNHILRTRAEKSGLKVISLLPHVSRNACLECDRRRVRAKNGMSAKNIEAVGHYLLANNEVVEFTSGGQKYILKVEVV